MKAVKTGAEYAGKVITPDRIPSSEKLAAACILSTVGGFLDIYTYLYRGKVFANAVTGNMVLFGLNLADMQWRACGKYLLAISFYALGVFCAEYIHRKLAVTRKIGWHQTILILEIICLLPVIFIPYGDWDFAVNVIIAFICALQVQTFRRVHGVPFASTMCTGNLRSGTEALFRKICGKDSGEGKKAVHYYLIIVFFVSGAAAGSLLLRKLGDGIFFLAPAGLVIVFGMVTTRRQLAVIRIAARKLLTGKRSSSRQ